MHGSPISSNLDFFSLEVASKGEGGKALPKWFPVLKVSMERAFSRLKDSSCHF